MSSVMSVMSVGLCREGVLASNRARVVVHQALFFESRLHFMPVLGGFAWASHSFTVAGMDEIGVSVVRGGGITGVVVGVQVAAAAESFAFTDGALSGVEGAAVVVVADKVVVEVVVGAGAAVVKGEVVGDLITSLLPLAKRLLLRSLSCFICCLRLLRGVVVCDVCVWFGNWVVIGVVVVVACVKFVVGAGVLSIVPSASVARHTRALIVPVSPPPGPCVACAWPFVVCPSAGKLSSSRIVLSRFAKNIAVLCLSCPWCSW